MPAAFWLYPEGRTVGTVMPDRRVWILRMSLSIFMSGAASKLILLPGRAVL